MFGLIKAPVAKAKKQDIYQLIADARRNMLKRGLSPSRLDLTADDYRDYLGYMAMMPPQQYLGMVIRAADESAVLASPIPARERLRVVGWEREPLRQA
jgi:hypothetical protein